MELTNTTFLAAHTTEGTQSQAFNWQNPVFPMPSPRARPSGPDRLPGTVYSHRPRWTPGKHARILAQIKATRTDLDPSFPRATPADHADPASATYPWSEIISNFAQGTKSYFDSLTAYALEQFYGLLPPAAPVTGAHPVTASSGAQTDPDAQKKAFAKALQKAGMTKEMATNILVAWTANSVPLNAYAVPTIYNPNFEFLPEDKTASSSGALLVYYKTGQGDQLVLKCYPPASEVDLRRLNDMTGIDPINPKLEARCLLASHIAHNILGWDIIPKASMGFFSGKACVVTPRIDGVTLKDAMNNNIAFAQLFLRAVRNGVVHTEEWGDRLSQQFTHDYIRLLVFTVLVVDHDRHFAQFIIGVDDHGINAIKSVDWDVTFGSKNRDDMLYIDIATHEQTSLWPSSIPQAIVNEFGKVTEASLKEAAETYELTGDEVSALMCRFEVIKKKLATIKKT